MNEKQIDAILREIYGYLMNQGIVPKADWGTVIEPMIEAAAERIARLSD